MALSNGSYDLIFRLAERSGFRWDHIVSLAAHQVYKPHRAAYLTIQKDLGIKTKDTLMVTANPTFGDIDQGAKANLMEKIEAGLWSRGWVMEKRSDELRVVGKARIRFLVPSDQPSCETS